MKLYLSNAIEFVRSRMDELSYSNDDMIVPADDDRNFDNTVEKLLPEAAEYTYLAAPVSSVSPSTGFSFRVGEDEVLELFVQTLHLAENVFIVNEANIIFVKTWIY